MVRNYVKKNKEPKYDEERLKRAVCDVKAGRMTAYKAARIYDVPYSTVYTHLVGSRGAVKKGKGRQTALPLEVESKLAEGLKCLEKWGFGLSRKETLEMVGRFVEQNNIKTPFKDSIPGEDWFLAFKNRHKLSLKVPQSVEFARKKATDPFTIFGYFDLLESTFKTLGIKEKPQNIWNLDESSLSIDPHKTKVVGERGKYASRVTSGPGRENTTILLMANAAGEKAPPLIIYKGRHMWDQWCAPEGKEYPGTVYAASKKGWMETDIFRNFFHRTLIPSLNENRPALIIYDGHGTHIDPDVIETAMNENITILKLPPHSSHLLQPLDLSVFKSFKDKWDSKLVSWQRQNIGRKLPKSMFSKFLGETWKSIEPEVIQNGFKKAGIFPFNRTVIADDKFCPEALRRWHTFQTTKGTNQSENTPASTENIPPPTVDASLPSTSNCNAHSTKDLIISPKPSTSFQAVSDKLSTSFEILLLETVRQSPHPEKTSRSRVGLGSEVLTNAEVLERLQKKKGLKNGKNIKKQRLHKNKESSSEDEDQEVQYEESDDAENLEEVIQEMEEQDLEETTILDTDLGENKWALVKYTSKKLLKHFIGQIIKQVEDGWEIKYLKKVSSKIDAVPKFEWPVIEDIDIVGQDDIIKILPQPLEDRRGLLYFNILFGGYNI